MSDEELSTTVKEQNKRLGWRDPPPADLAKEVYDALFPPRPERPPVRTLADNLPEGITDGDPVMPGLKKPEPLVFYKERQPDELVPAATRLWRVGLNDLPQLGWLIERLMRKCPHVPPHTWQTTLVSFMHDNSFFQRSPNAVGLARFVNDVFAPPHVEVLFLFHTDLGPEGGSQRNSQGEKDAIAIVRAMREWGRHQGATEVRRLNELSDMPTSVFTNDLRGEKRDEAWIAIR
jgi:hypothetical protein